MARIRTIKPSFFRHEQLQDLEREAPGKYPMMVFSALWGHCDRNGVFEYNPRYLKLDILPFLDFDMAETLDILSAAGFIKTFEADGKTWGFIESFREHQRLSGKEASQESKFPDPEQCFIEASQGNSSEAPKETPETDGEEQVNSPDDNGEAPGKRPGAQEGKGRERNGVVARAREAAAAIDEPKAGSPPKDEKPKTEKQNQDRKAEAERMMAVGNRVLDLAGIDAARWTGSFLTVQQWLNAKADPDLHIYPTVERLTKAQCLKNPNWSPKSLNYFTEAIQEAVNQSLTDIPPFLQRKPPGQSDEPLYAGATLGLWRTRASAWRVDPASWVSDWGFPPDDQDTNVPKEIRHELGIETRKEAVNG